MYFRYISDGDRTVKMRFTLYIYYLSTRTKPLFLRMHTFYIYLSKTCNNEATAMPKHDNPFIEQSNFKP